MENVSMPVALDVQLAAVMEVAGDASFVIDGHGTILQASARTGTIFGKPMASACLYDLMPAADAQAVRRAMNASLQSGQWQTATVNSAISENEFLPLQLDIAVFRRPPYPLQWIVTGRSLARQAASEQRLRQLAGSDALTGLPNRAALSERLAALFADCETNGEGFCVLALGLDGFRKVNDALGHQIGDRLLQAAAVRLGGVLTADDLLIRTGGDEFIALLHRVIAPNDVQAVARRMISAIQLPFEIQGHSLYIGVSIGATVFSNRVDNEITLLAQASAALCRAKETGKGRCVLFDSQQFDRPQHDVLLEAAMFDAVRNGEFSLHYQPVVNVSTSEIVGFEVLMRWMHPELGMVPPNRFIPMAENNGLINLLGAWVLKAACAHLQQFERAAGRMLYVSVNVSPRQFRNEQFLNILDEAMRLSGIRGSQLVLEITEGLMMFDPDHTETMLHAVAARGVGIAVDDFGTGYSSLAYLKRFPVTALKIDRAFVKELPGSLKDAAICNVITSLASNLGLKTIAEGVETDEQMRYLVGQGCVLIQGYLTGRPMIPEDVLSLLALPTRSS